ncbi:MAG: hypothetical protein ACPKM0_04270 [Pleomorphochaeta sp.]
MNDYDNNSHPYDEDTCVKKTTSDDASSVVLILGIISIVSIFSWIFSFVGLVLGIIALVKGTKIRHNSSAAMAGWVLSIISISIFALGVIFFIGFLMPPFWCFI